MRLAVVVEACSANVGGGLPVAVSEHSPGSWQDNRRRLRDYLEVVREIERPIKQVDATLSRNLDLPDAPVDAIGDNTGALSIWAPQDHAIDDRVDRGCRADTAGVPDGLLTLLDATQAELRLPASVARVESGLTQQPGLVLQVEAQLLVQFVVLPGPMRQRVQALAGQLAAAGWCERVIPRAAVVLRRPPFSANQAA